MPSVTDIQLSYTSLNDLLVNSNWLGIHAFCTTLYCINHFIFDNTELQPPIAVPLYHFMSNFSWISCESVFCLKYCCERINMVSQLMVGGSLLFKKTWFFSIFGKQIEQNLKFHHCTRSRMLPLNTQSKGIFYQAFLINYVGCDENLKCVGSWPYSAPFVFFAGTTLNGFLGSSSHPIHKLFRMEEEDNFISNETRSLLGVYWTR